MRVEKWQALGNDYLIVEAAGAAVRRSRPRASGCCATATRGRRATACSSSRAPDEPGFVARLRIFNPDGSEAELSGNGAREAIMYLHRRGWTDAREFSIQTVAGELRPTIESETRCTVDMGRARLRDEGELEADGRTLAPTSTSRSATRRPRSAWPIDARSRRSTSRAIGPVDRAPREVPEPHERLAGGPSSAPDAIRARIFERGVGETLSSGTGATGAAIATSCAAATRRSPCSSTAGS